MLVDGNRRIAASPNMRPTKKSNSSRTRKPNRDKETESPYLVHPLTYRQVYLTKNAYFIEKIHWEFVEMA